MAGFYSVVSGFTLLAHWVAEVSVVVEPVSGGEFPANREINKEFRHFSLSETIIVRE
jgi:hypothetical protein